MVQTHTHTHIQNYPFILPCLLTRSPEEFSKSLVLATLINPLCITHILSLYVKSTLSLVRFTVPVALPSPERPILHPYRVRCAMVVVDPKASQR